MRELEVVPKLEKRLNYLALIANIALFSTAGNDHRSDP